jgi:hypothetical protein
MAVNNLSSEKYGDSDITGDLLPSVYVNRIILESGGDYVSVNNPHINEFGVHGDRLAGARSIGKATPTRNLKVKINLNLKDKLEDNLISRWFLNLDFKKYLEVLVVLSNRKDKTLEFTTANKVNLVKEVNFLSNLNVLRTIGFLDYQVLQIPEIENPLGDSEVYQDSSGNNIYDIDLFTEFSVPNKDPSHLSIICFSFINMEKLIDDFSLSVNNTDLHAQALGSFNVYNIIDNHQTVDSAVVFYDPNGNIWQGPVHQHEGKWMAGARHTTELHPYLTRAVVPNTIVQDFRNVEETQKHRYDLTGITTTIYPSMDKIFKQFVDYNLDVNVKKAFASDIFLSRGLGGEAKFLFGLDFKKLCIENTTYPKLLKKNLRLLDDFKIERINILRRRIEKTNDIRPFKDEDRSPTDNTYYIPNEEIIVYSADGDTFLRGNVFPNGNMLREIILDLDNSEGIRHFSGRDVSIGSDITFGEYQYGFEVFVKDPTRDFLMDQLTRLGEAKKSLVEYYNLARRPRRAGNRYLKSDNPHIKDETEIINTFGGGGYYDIKTNKFVKIFDRLINTLTSIGSKNLDAIATLCAVYVELGAMTTQAAERTSRFLDIITNPRSGTPTGINYTITLVNDLIKKMQVILGFVVDNKGNNSVGAAPSDYSNGTSGVKKNTFSYKQYFNNMFFDAGIDRRTGFDYLGKPPVRRQNESLSGLESITYEDFITRANQETLKYFVQDADITLDQTPPGSDQKYNVNSTTEDRKYSYFSPYTIFLAGTTSVDAGTQNMPDLTPDGIRLKIAQILKYKNSGDGIRRIPFFSRHTSRRSRIPAEQLQIRDALADVLASNNLTIEVSSETSAAEALRRRFNRSFRVSTPRGDGQVGDTNIPARDRDERADRARGAMGQDIDRGRQGVDAGQGRERNTLDGQREYHEVTEEVRENLVDIHTSRDGDVLEASGMFFKLLVNLILDESFLNTEGFATRAQDNKKEGIAFFNLRPAPVRRNRTRDTKRNGLQTLREAARGPALIFPPTYTDSFRALPNQIKSLFVSSYRPDQTRVDYHSSDSLDPFKESFEALKFAIHYFCLSRVEVLTRYSENIFQAETPSAGDFGELLSNYSRTETARTKHIKEPIFRLLTAEILSSAREEGRDLLCRFVPYRSSVLGIKPPEGIKLNVVDNYFVISSNMTLADVDSDLFTPSDDHTSEVPSDQTDQQGTPFGTQIGGSSSGFSYTTKDSIKMGLESERNGNQVDSDAQRLDPQVFGVEEDSETISKVVSKTTDSKTMPKKSINTGNKYG